MNRLKDGHEKIVHHIRHLSGQSYLKEAQKFWPNYLFHFTDITNVVEILTEGCLYSRELLHRKRKKLTDIASPDILGKTSSKWKEYVRLYFRPRTPMQYVNEGIRPKNKLQYGGAHCPVPIVFMFDAVSILRLNGTYFSDENLASEFANVKDSVEFYLSLPFERIYHDSGFSGIDEDEKRKIILQRHAEVIIPDKLELDGIKKVICRSKSEFETLIHLLPETVRIKWKNKLAVDNRGLLFFSEWPYVEKAYLDEASIELHFNSAKICSPYLAKLKVIDFNTKKAYSWEEDDYEVRKPLTLKLPGECTGSYEVSFFLDNNLAYQNFYKSGLDMLF